MRTLTTNVDIKEVSPDQVFKWFLSLTNKKYTEWHPAHKKWRWRIKHKNEIEVGDKLIFREKVGKFDIRFTGKLTKIEENTCMQFKHKHLPVCISFLFKQTEVGTRVNFESKIGYKKFGSFIDFWLRKIYPEPKFSHAIISHVHEEFELLEHIFKQE